MMKEQTKIETRRYATPEMNVKELHLNHIIASSVKEGGATENIGEEDGEW